MWHVPLLALLSRWIGDKRVTLPIPKYTKEDVLFLKAAHRGGEYRAVIDRRYPLEQVVEATRYVETGAEDRKRRPDGERRRSSAFVEPRRGSEGMRAVVHDRYGAPGGPATRGGRAACPADDEVLVRVHATSVTRTDCHMRQASPILWRFMLGLLRPKRKILGLEFSGVVEAVGSAVTEWAVGDRVFGLRSGSHAEYICVREAGLLARMPEGMTFEEAAGVCDGMSQGLAALRSGRVGPGTRLVVYGASGSCGTAAVQLAAYLGAHVTAVCNTKNVELVRSLGADEVIDYERADFTKNGQTYDVVLDAVGKHSLLRSRRSLVPGGLYVATDRLYNFPLAFLTRWIGTRKVVFDVSGYKREDVLLLKDLLEAGTYRAIIDRTYPLEDVVEATRYVESWQKTGNVVLTLNGGPPR